MSAGSGAAWLNCSGVWMFSGSDRWCLGGVCGVSGGCLGVSGWCLGSVWGLLVVSGGCWMVSGWCLRHFFQSGHFVPPPHVIQESRTPRLIGLSKPKELINLNLTRLISFSKIKQLVLTLKQLNLVLAVFLRRCFCISVCFMLSNGQYRHAIISSLVGIR